MDTCVCDNRLFLDNTACGRCGREVGFCPCTRAMTAVEPHRGDADPAARRCLATGRTLFPCSNRSLHRVCNRYVLAPEDGSDAEALCDYCKLNDTIPDLSIPGHLERWADLEAAKRRVLWGFDHQGIPYGGEGSGCSPPLSFRFMADAVPGDEPGQWIPQGPGPDGKPKKPIYTGHASGVITLNLREADSVAREKLRVQMHEPKRTLVGHLRHELGHYVWDLLVKDDEPERARCVGVFGNHEDPTYADAMKAYYADGPAAGWPATHISGYATMHPWEDFAETFGWYTLMMGALYTADAGEVHLPLAAPDTPLDERLGSYLQLSVQLNEQARNFGLPDFVSEAVPEPVREKLAYVDGLLERNRVRPAADAACDA
ncbi:putative zinc-binding metallopeptidase [Phycisphaera mikurensis]|uniref:Zinc-ribbon domain-containing protein n=1 Tax=Phycisphaera mikurensis (strain NBRC 102666 / KCTC 22515 / FYK2301M01) TaxID=1142394 RepID=I0IBJ4_PHYMF|nr:putative zinc-binding metallopeptidase [Phycisphaera mikurensis]MBB6442838.1 hypothetical protein [Phycisphaera mikurensis]BAM02632.1 hypothetical protein PSMK_04730 [Phycisphaera mikurensis NBRC 102666]